MQSTTEPEGADPAMKAPATVAKSQESGDSGWEVGCGAEGSAAPPLAVKGTHMAPTTPTGQNLSWPPPSEPCALQPQCGVLGRLRTASSSWILRPRIQSRGGLVTGAPLVGVCCVAPVLVLFYFTYQTLF